MSDSHAITCCTLISRKLVLVTTGELPDALAALQEQQAEDDLWYGQQRAAAELWHEQREEKLRALMRRLRLTKESCRARKRHESQLQRDLTSARQSAAMHTEALERCAALEAQLEQARAAREQSSRMNAQKYTPKTQGGFGG